MRPSLTVPLSKPVSSPARPLPPRPTISFFWMSSLSPSVSPWRATSSPLSFPAGIPCQRLRRSDPAH